MNHPRHGRAGAVHRGPSPPVDRHADCRQQGRAARHSGADRPSSRADAGPSCPGPRPVEREYGLAGQPSPATWTGDAIPSSGTHGPPAGRTWSPDAEPVPAASTCTSSLRDWARSRLEWRRRTRSGRRGAVRAHRRRLDHPPPRHRHRRRNHPAQGHSRLLPRAGSNPPTRTRLRRDARPAHRRTDLPDWISTARAVRLPGMTGFARGPTADLEAVIAGLTVHWSSGGTEGAVNRVKKDQEAAIRTCRIRTLTEDDPAPVTLRDHSPRPVPEPFSGPSRRPQLAPVHA